MAIVVPNAADPLAEARPLEILLGPHADSLSHEGVFVDYAGSLFVPLSTEEDEIEVGARLVLDLEDLKNRAVALIGLIDLPRAPCDQQSLISLDEPVVTILQTRLTSSGASIILTSDIVVEVWLCSVFGPSLQRRITLDDVSLRFQLSRRSPKTIGLDLELPDGVANALQLIREVAKVDLEAEVRRVLQGILRTDLLELSVPDSVEPLDPQIAAASFRTIDGKLYVELELFSILDRAALLQGEVEPVDQ